MKISRENYESWFVDYLEGNLDNRLVDEFIAFIQANPDLKEELALFEPVKLPAGEISYRVKKNLYRERLDSEKEFENTAIARMEGDLTQDEIHELDDYLTRKPEKKKEVLLFGKARLTPEVIVFTRKSKLYKKPVSKTMLLWSSRIAAVLILAWVASLTLFRQSDPKETQTMPAINLNEKQGTINGHSEINAKTVLPASLSNPSEIKTGYLASSTENRNKPGTVLTAIQGKATASRESLQAFKYLVPLNTGIRVNEPEITLMASGKVSQPDNFLPEEEERLLADIVKDKLNLGKFSFRRLSRTGLTLAVKLTGEKFSYSTNNDDKVTAFAYESRLVGLSITAGKD